MRIKGRWRRTNLEDVGEESGGGGGGGDDRRQSSKPSTAMFPTITGSISAY